MFGVFKLYVKNISKKFDREVLKNVSAEFENGTINAVAGKNGCGKSTLLKIITTILKQDSGDIFINDKNLKDNPEFVRKKIGYVSQENSLLDDLSVRNNIIFFSDVYRVERNFFNLSDEVLNKKLKNLSGGMRKKINILISLLNNPEFLILDEPTANLDLYHKEEILNLIKDFKNVGKCVIFTSHNIDEIIIADKLFVINNGNIVFNDTPSKLNINNDFKENLYKLIF